MRICSQYRTSILSILVGVIVATCITSTAQPPAPPTNEAPALSAEAWLQSAEKCGDSLCRFSALQSALQQDQNNRSALLALADYYRDREQREKSRDLLQKLVRLDEADFQARVKLADLYMEVGDRDRALAEYARLASQFPGVHWLKLQLANSYERAGFLEKALPLANAAFVERPDGEQEQELILRLNERTRDNPSLIAALRRIVANNTGDTARVARLARALAAEGDSAGAEQALKAAIADHPDDASLRLALVDVLSQNGKKQQSADELDAMASRSDQGEVRQRLNWLHSSSSIGDKDDPYLAVLDAAARPADARGEKAVALSDVRIDRVQRNGLASTRVQQFLVIGTAQGAREYATRSVQYAPASESLHVLHARLHKADGRILEAEDGGENSVADAKTSMYYDVRARVLRYPGVEPGDVLELDYRITPEAKENPYGDYFGALVLLQGNVPAQLKRYVLVTPSDRNFYVTERRVPRLGETEVVNGERVQRWEMHDMPALPNEPRGPSATEIGAYVNISTFATFEDLGGWYAKLLAPQLELDSTLREIASRMLTEHPDEQDRIRAIHRFVLQNTHYVAFEFGIYSYKPYPVSQVYARRFGDCKDKASLMIALLRATGTEAQLALVRTRRLGLIAPEAASIVPFNHAIAYVPRYDLYLDGTAEYAGSRELPLEDQGAMALTVGSDGSAVMRRIPVTSAADNYSKRVVRANVRPDGAIEFAGTASTRGEDAPGLRRDFEVVEHQRESFRQTLADVFPSIRVETVEVQGAHDLEKDVTVNFRGMLDTFAGRPSLSLASSWITRKYVQTLAPLATRTQPLSLPAGWTTEEELHFTLPNTATRVEMPRDQRLRTAFGSADFTYARNGQEIVIRTQVQFAKLQISPDEYEEFREFCRSLEMAFKQEVKVALQ